MTADEFLEGLSLRPKFSFVQANQLAARLLPRRGDTICLAPDLDRLAREGIDLEKTNGEFVLHSPPRDSKATGKSCPETGACDNATEHPATISIHACHLRGAGCGTSRFGKMRFTGSRRHDMSERRPAHDVRRADLLSVPSWGDGIQRDTNSPRSATAARTCRRLMQFDCCEAPGPERAWHRGKASHDDRALRHLPVLEDGRLGASAGSCPDGPPHSPGAAAPSNEN